MSLAINRKAVIDRILQGAATEANQWMPADTFGYNPEIKNIPFDAAQAKKLLAEAGFPDGFKLTIHVPNDRYPQAPETMQAVAQFWTRIGIKTQVEVLPWASYSSRANKNEFAVSVLAWGNGTGEASYALVNVLGGRSQEGHRRLQLEPLQQPGRGQGPGRFHRGVRCCQARSHPARRRQDRVG
jgi:peptide/nickel transport system substrate-binding protein